MASAADAVADIPEGASPAVGGFGLCGIPTVLIGARKVVVLMVHTAKDGSLGRPRAYATTDTGARLGLSPSTA